MITLLRPYLLVILAALTALGVVPPALAIYIEAHPEAVLAATLFFWGVTAFRRNRRASTAAQEMPTLKQPRSY